MATRQRFVSDAESRALTGFRTLADGNPFLHERVGAERAALGEQFVKTSTVWHVDADVLGLNPNIPLLAATVEPMVETLRQRLADGTTATHDELLAYEALVRYLLFARYEGDFFQLIWDESAGRPSTRSVPVFDQFATDADHFLQIPDVRFPFEVDAAHLFAWGYQIRRAFHHTYRQIYGGSLPAARLRAEVWNSVFTCDVSRYRRSLFASMGDLPTLVLGESGTGKELVARAIGLSRYIPFDAEQRCFTAECASLYHSVNLSALSTPLIESELFGHRRGSFTGAVEDRAGWLEVCEPLGAIFLDEIGEVDPVIQVMLLRVLQDRTFQRVGETQQRRFEGKIIAATNRDLELEMEAGRFRRDFYYRVCADVIRTPTLSEQIADAPDELHNLVLILARRIVGNDDADALADEVCAWVNDNLGLDYAWPGNIRELEQCLRNVMIRGSYQPPRLTPSAARRLEIFRDDMSADELLSAHCTRVYHRAGSYEKAARQLGLDRRTVRARIDPELLERLRTSAQPGARTG